MDVRYRKLEENGGSQRKLVANDPGRDAN